MSIDHDYFANGLRAYRRRWFDFIYLYSGVRSCVLSMAFGR